MPNSTTRTPAMDMLYNTTYGQAYGQVVGAVQHVRSRFVVQHT